MWNGIPWSSLLEVIRLWLIEANDSSSPATTTATTPPRFLMNDVENVLYSHTQSRFLALITSCVAPFSVLGSSLIVYTILTGQLPAVLRSTNNATSSNNPNNNNNSNNGGTAVSATPSNNNNNSLSPNAPRSNSTGSNRSGGGGNQNNLRHSMSTNGSHTTMTANRTHASTSSSPHTPYWHHTYHRLILGVSAFDILSSLGVTVFGAWSIPAQASYFVPGARASTKLWCNLSGLFAQCFVVSIWYTISLMVYFLLLIKWEWPAHTIARRVEPWMHLLSIGVPLLLGVYAVTQGYMNPLDQAPGRCWIIDYPPQCSVTDGVDCLRGEASGTLSWLLGLGTAFFAFGTVVATMVVLYTKVRSVELKLRNYIGHRLLNRCRRLQRTRETAIRGLVYCGAFLVVFLPGAILQAVEQPPTRQNRTLYFTLSFFFTTLTPLQGVLNALIYFGTSHHQLSLTNLAVWGASTSRAWLGSAAAAATSVVWRTGSSTSSLGNTGGVNTESGEITNRRQWFRQMGRPLSSLRPGQWSLSEDDEEEEEDDEEGADLENRVIRYSSKQFLDEHQLQILQQVQEQQQREQQEQQQQREQQQAVGLNPSPQPESAATDEDIESGTTVRQQSSSSPIVTVEEGDHTLGKNSFLLSPADNDVQPNTASQDPQSAPQHDELRNSIHQEDSRTEAEPIAITSSTAQNPTTNSAICKQDEEDQQETTADSIDSNKETDKASIAMNVASVESLTGVMMVDQEGMVDVESPMDVGHGVEELSKGEGVVDTADNSRIPLGGAATAPVLEDTSGNALLQEALNGTNLEIVFVANELALTTGGDTGGKRGDCGPTGSTALPHIADSESFDANDSSVPPPAVRISSSTTTTNISAPPPLIPFDVNDPDLMELSHHYDSSESMWTEEKEVENGPDSDLKRDFACSEQEVVPS